MGSSEKSKAVSDYYIKMGYQLKTAFYYQQREICHFLKFVGQILLTCNFCFAILFIVLTDYIICSLIKKN